MRSDALGFFWEDLPTIKATKEKAVKRTPPEPFWLDVNYLPYLDEALAFDVPTFSDMELAFLPADTKLVFDIECYPNYFCCAFKSIQFGKAIVIEMTRDGTLDTAKLRWILERFQIITFNGIHYDAPIAAIALAGAPTDVLFDCTTRIINYNERPSDVLKSLKVKALKFDHIDIKEVAPLSASLKKYAGRLHCQKMQDLPFPPGTVLTLKQIAVCRYYCVNDLTNTELLYLALKKQIELREAMTLRYGVDVRSKSDAQVAEAVISSELRKLCGVPYLPRAKVEVGREYRYEAPHYVKFQSENMRYAFDVIRNAPFTVGIDGAIALPEDVSSLVIPIGGTEYQMGIGGLHSKEKKTTHYADDVYTLHDVDAESFYPRIILNLGLFPEHLGREFLRVYEAIVTERVVAKHNKNKVVADSLKITINGSFGKFGSMFSILYGPNLLIQTTITGQLLLLMLIEALEMSGIHVVSANTDGIVIKCHKDKREMMAIVLEWWQKTTMQTLEETRYSKIASRDVNNYVAVKLDGKVKTKGVYAVFEEGEVDWLKKNPTGSIIVDAIINKLVNDTPVLTTISQCKDFSKFIVVRTAKDGAVKDNEYLGRAIRWYHSTSVDGEIINAANGYKIAQSDGGRPCMVLPTSMPEDVDFNYYVQRAERELTRMGYA